MNRGSFFFNLIGMEHKLTAHHTDDTDFLRIKRIQFYSPVRDGSTIAHGFNRGLRTESDQAPEGR